MSDGDDGVWHAATPAKVFAWHEGMRADAPAPVVRADLYTAPTLRPCVGIEPERGDVVTVGLQDIYGALVTELPFGGAAAMGSATTGGIDLCDRLRATLPWMVPAIRVIERQLQVAIWAGRPWVSFRPICLVEPAGVGKSHLPREIGRHANIGHASLDLGGMHDSAALVPTSRGWTNTKPTWPAQMMNAFKVGNPILTLDELDKAGGSRRNGDPLRALLGMLEPSTARTYFDTCLMCEVDLSQVCWVCTANDAAALPAPLASRLDVVEVGRPDPGHFDVILGGLLTGMAGRWGVPVTSMPVLPSRAEAALRDVFARRRSIRLLKRQVEDVVAALVAGPRLGAH